MVTQARKKKTKKADNELSEFQEKCCHEFIRNGGDRTEAFIKCHDTAKEWKKTSVYVNASKLFNLPKVKERVAELQQILAERMLVSDEKVLRGFANIAFFDPRNLFDTNGNLINIKELDTETAMALAGIDIVIKPDPLNKDEVLYIKKVKFFPKNPALESLGKHLGLFQKDNEQKKAVLMSDQELEEEVKQLRGYLTGQTSGETSIPN